MKIVVGMKIAFFTAYSTVILSIGKQKSLNIMLKRRKKPGPKGLFKQSMVERAFELCLLGLRNNDLATAFGVHPDTIELWLRNHPEFAKAVRAGRVEADAKVAKALYERATGYSCPDTVVLTNRVTEYDENGKPLRSYTEPLIVPVVKHYPPDGYSAQKWLAIRQREYWTEVQKSEHTLHHKGSIDMNHVMEQISNTSQFTDDELKLAAKLGLQRARQTALLQENNN